MPWFDKILSYIIKGFSVHSHICVKPHVPTAPEIKKANLIPAPGRCKCNGNTDPVKTSQKQVSVLCSVIHFLARLHMQFCYHPLSRRAC